MRLEKTKVWVSQTLGFHYQMELDFKFRVKLSRIKVKGNFMEAGTSQPPHPFLPLSLYLVELCLNGELNVVGV
jgi:hypothetical protein